MPDTIVCRSPENQANTRPVVLLHGFTGSPASWDAVADVLASRFDIATVALALPGHHPDVPVVPGWAGNIDGVAARLRDAATRGLVRLPAHLCGYSLGARVALAVAASHAGLVSRLTLIGVHPGLPGEPEQTSRRAADKIWIDRLRQRGIDDFVAAWQEQPLFASQNVVSARMRDHQHRIRSGHDPVALAASLAHMGLAEMPDHRAFLTALAIPVTLLTGQHDAKFSALARELVQRAASASGPRALDHLDVPDAGHNVVLEQPDLIAESIARAHGRAP